MAEKTDEQRLEELEQAFFETLEQARATLARYRAGVAQAPEGNAGDTLYMALYRLDRDIHEERLAHLRRLGRDARAELQDAAEVVQ